MHGLGQIGILTREIDEVGDRLEGVIDLVGDGSGETADGCETLGGAERSLELLSAWLCRGEFWRLRRFFHAGHGRGRRIRETSMRWPLLVTRTVSKCSMRSPA